MFSAVDHGKAGHWFEDKGQPWRRAIRIEDTLTAIVFDHLLALSGRTFAQLLKMLLRHPDGADRSYDASWVEADGFEIRFWPRLDGNVEPDVLIVDDAQEHVLIVECKFGQEHSAKQLGDEITAVRTDYSGYSIDAVAFGDGHHAATRELAEDGLPAWGATWREMARAVWTLADSPIAPSERRTLAHLETAMSFFGYRRFSGLHDGLACLEPPIGRADLLQLAPFAPERRPSEFRALPELCLDSADFDALRYWG